MTGEAEAEREVQPDPLNPQIANGSFEEVLDERAARRRRACRLALPAAAQAQRRSATAPDGSRFVTFQQRRSPAAAAMRCKASPSTAAKSRSSSSTFGPRPEHPPRQPPNEWPLIVVHVLRRSPRHDRRSNRSARSTAPSTGKPARHGRASHSRPAKRLPHRSLGGRGRASLDDLRTVRCAVTGDWMSRPTAHRSTGRIKLCPSSR